MRRRPTFRCLVALAVLAASAGTARGGELDVSPVLVALSRDEASAVVTVRNRSRDVVRYQVSLFAWDQSPAGEMKLSPTTDVVAFPRVLSIAPGEARIVRVGAVVPFGQVERAYRLFIEEMPPAPTPESASRVQVLSRIGIPVFLAPDRAVEKAVLGDVRVGGREAEFEIRNVGNVRVRPSWVRLVTEDGAGKPLDVRALESWYVLASGERRYAVQLPAERCDAVRSVAVEVALAAEVLRSRAATPQGGCAR